MKRIVKSKALWLVLILLVSVAAIAAPSQIITLSNGDEYEFAGVTTGTNLVPPSLLCCIVDRLPASLTNFASKVLGGRVKWTKLLSPEHTVASVWFRLRSSNAAVPPGIIHALPFRLADEDGNERVVPGFFRPELNTSFFRSGYGWNHVDLVNVPRRSPVLTVLFGDQNGANIQRVSFRNPLYGSYPQWEPKDTLPATRDIEDLHVQIGKLEIKPVSPPVQSGPPKGPFHVQTDVSWASGSNGSPKWAFVRAGLDDATGNHMDGFEPRPFNFSQDNKHIRFPALWPGEDAWRLTLVFERKSDFLPESIVTFTNVPIPPVGASNFAPITNSLGDIKVRISSFRHDRNSQNPSTQNSFSYIGIDLPDHPADWVAGIIDVQTPLGKPDLRSALDEDPDGTRHLGYIPTNASTVNVTVAVQKAIKLEFYLKPPTP